MQRPGAAPAGPAWEQFVQAWLDALDGAGSVPLTGSERRRQLAALAGALHAGLVAERFDPAAGRPVGAELVRAGFTAPAALGRSITVVTTRLLDAAGLPDRAPAAARVTALVESLATGFAEAAQQRILDGQEAVRSAAIRAEAEAVRAERAWRATEARLQHYATHDPVTGLPNRVVLLGRLEELLDGPSPGTRLALCCLDLDRFATITDSLGHDLANRLLREVTNRLRQLSAATGWQLTHIQVGQFALLVEHTTCSEDADKVADWALSVFADPFRLGELELPVTATCGVVEQPAGPDNPTWWLQAAQTALHWAQTDGHARWRLFDPDRSTRDGARYRLSAALPSALRQGQLVPYYQPLVDLASRRVVGFEALARWRHPEHGLLVAGEFIDLARRTGQLVQLSYHLLRQACQQAAGWPPDTDRAPYLSVNLAPGQLHQPGLVGHVAQILDHTGLPPHRLQLEITEDTIIDAVRSATTDLATPLNELVRLGVRLAVDDFGTGQSNLTRLLDLPVSVVKLDASLAWQAPGPAPRRPRHDEFLAAVVQLARTLELAVTAEGIATAADEHRMRSAGCDTGQGFHLSQPVPAGQVTSVAGYDWRHLG